MLVIPFSRNVRTANLTVTAGTILFDESTKVCNILEKDACVFYCLTDYF